MTTLSNIVNELDRICTEIDESDALPNDLLERFASTQLEQKDKLSAYVAVIDQAQAASAYFQERANKLTKRAKTAERVASAVKERLLFVMQQHPELPWQSSDGDKFTACNSQPSLEIDLNYYKTSYNYILNDLFGIPEQFIDIVQLTCLNSQKVKKHLLDGNKLSWARLQHSKYLRIT